MPGSTERARVRQVEGIEQITDAPQRTGKAEMEGLYRMELNKCVTIRTIAGGFRRIRKA
jgi:hypothetical protein